MHNGSFEQGAAEYKSEMYRFHSCQGIDADTLKPCGDPPEYTQKCAALDCEKYVCENHSLMLPGIAGRWCFSCARKEMEMDDAAELLLATETV